MSISSNHNFPGSHLIVTLFSLYPSAQLSEVNKQLGWDLSFSEDLGLADLERE